VKGEGWWDKWGRELGNFRVEEELGYKSFEVSKNVKLMIITTKADYRMTRKYI
jgi:hypothetical protein